LLAFDFRFDLNAFRALLDMQDTSFGHDTHMEAIVSGIRSTPT